MSYMLLYYLAMTFTLIGALNWGVVGVTSVSGNRFNFVDWLASGILEIPVAADIVYIIVGLGALVVLITMHTR